MRIVMELTRKTELKTIVGTGVDYVRNGKRLAHAHSDVTGV